MPNRHGCRQPPADKLHRLQISVPVPSSRAPRGPLGPVPTPTSDTSFDALLSWYAHQYQSAAAELLSGGRDGSLPTYSLFTRPSTTPDTKRIMTYSEDQGLRMISPQDTSQAASIGVTDGWVRLAIPEHFRTNPGTRAALLELETAMSLHRPREETATAVGPKRSTQVSLDSTYIPIVGLAKSIYQAPPQLGTLEGAGSEPYHTDPHRPSHDSRSWGRESQSPPVAEPTIRVALGGLQQRAQSSFPDAVASRQLSFLGAVFGVSSQIAQGLVQDCARDLCHLVSGHSTGTEGHSTGHHDTPLLPPTACLGLGSLFHSGAPSAQQHPISQEVEDPTDPRARSIPSSAASDHSPPFRHSLEDSVTFVSTLLAQTPQPGLMLQRYSSTDICPPSEICSTTPWIGVDSKQGTQSSVTDPDAETSSPQRATLSDGEEGEATYHLASGTRARPHPRSRTGREELTDSGVLRSGRAGKPSHTTAVPSKIEPHSSVRPFMRGPHVILKRTALPQGSLMFRHLERLADAEAPAGPDTARHLLVPLSMIPPSLYLCSLLQPFPKAASFSNSRIGTSLIWSLMCSKALPLPLSSIARALPQTRSATLASGEGSLPAPVPDQDPAESYRPHSLPIRTSPATRGGRARTLPPPRKTQAYYCLGLHKTPAGELVSRNPQFNAVLQLLRKQCRALETLERDLDELVDSRKRNPGDGEARQHLLKHARSPTTTAPKAVAQLAAQTLRRKRNALSANINRKRCYYQLYYKTHVGLYHEASQLLIEHMIQTQRAQIFLLANEILQTYAAIDQVHKAKSAASPAPIQDQAPHRPYPGRSPPPSARTRRPSSIFPPGWFSLSNTERATVVRHLFNCALPAVLISLNLPDTITD